MRKFNILVFPCGSEIGLELYRSLNLLKEITLFGVSSVADHGKFCFENYIEIDQFIDNPDCIRELAYIVQEKNIDAIYPATDLAISLLKQNEQFLGCTVIASELCTTEICLSKEKTYLSLSGKVKVPTIFNDEVEKFPVFVKPKIGYGSRGAKKIESKTALNNHLSEFNNCIITEYLPGDEFTVDCFTNYKGELLFTKPRKRERIQNGISVNTRTYMDDAKEFDDFATLLNENLKFNGAWFFQVKRNKNNELVLMEIASRFGGSSSIWKGIGINLPLMSILNQFNIELKLLAGRHYVEMDRSLNNSFSIDLKFNHIYIDFDDCILLNGKLNLEAVQLLYFAIQKNIRTHLITRHQNDDLEKLLQQYKIQALFDEIIHLKNGEKKSDYVSFRDSIFIDDSFSERRDVSEVLGIPTFGTESIICFVKN